MNNPLVGSYIRIHQSRAIGFDHVSTMLLEHFDCPEHAGKTFILGDYVYHPVNHFRQLYPDSRIVIYQLEQMVGSKTWHPVSRTIDHIRGADEIWDLDRLNVTYLGWHQVAVDRVVPMLYTKSLRRVTLQPDPTIDVLFYGYLNDRRYRIIRQLEQRLYNRIKLMWLYGVHGEVLDQYIGDCRIILNLHAFEPWHRQEQVRIFYPLINGRLVVSETSELSSFDDCIVETDSENLADTLLYWLSEDRWRDHGLVASERFRARSEAWLRGETEGPVQ
jgi:hypothetical protein